MSWFLEHWQTVAALGVVILTVVIFARHLARPGNKSGCGGGCGCPAKPKALANRR